MLSSPIRVQVDVQVDEDSLRIIAGSFYIPKESKKYPKGDDAHFICEEENIFGVADGVGGWAFRGVDPGEFSRQLMGNANLAVKFIPDPQELLNFAYEHTCTEGSSTACIIRLQGKALVVSNVGDSGFIVIRNGKCIYHSPVQTYQFNYPYQLGKVGGRDPSCAEILKVSVEEGDIVVAGTDGLFDNLFDTDIEDMVKEGIREGMDANELASMIAQNAFFSSYDQYAITPFSMEAELAGVEHDGGKIDDITVVVAFVVNE